MEGDRRKGRGCLCIQSNRGIIWGSGRAGKAASFIQSVLILETFARLIAMCYVVYLCVCVCKCIQVHI